MRRSGLNLVSVEGSSPIRQSPTRWLLVSRSLFRRPNNQSAGFALGLTRAEPFGLCSIQIGNGLSDAPVGSVRGIYLVVTDFEAVRGRLLERGVDVGEIRHKTPIWSLGREFRGRA
jgi:hypothetical protein